MAKQKIDFNNMDLGFDDMSLDKEHELIYKKVNINQLDENPENSNIYELDKEADEFAFFESTDFEDAIRNAISIGGDSDTIAAITGSIAEAYYGVPTDIRKHAITFLDERLLKILVKFEDVFPAKVEKKKTYGSVGIKGISNKEANTNGGRNKMVESALRKVLKCIYQIYLF